MQPTPGNDKRRKTVTLADVYGLLSDLLARLDRRPPTSMTVTITAPSGVVVGGDNNGTVTVTKETE